ncbi:MAG: HAD family hydrolase [bacterium]|nr:HAD family hydrolase [bacterium]
MKDKLLIIDLDETLIYSSLTRLSFPEDFRVGQYFVYKRPGLENFLKFINENFKLAVWTSSTSEYANDIVKQLFADQSVLKFVWARDKCVSKIDIESREQYWIKDLKKVKKLGFELEKILVIDDSPEKLQRNYGNHIPVIPFVGDLGDDELSRLVNFLESIRNLNSVRSIEKRNWRNTI